MAGAISAIDALKKNGHVLCIVTGRSENNIPATELWVKEHFPNTFKGIHFGLQLSPGTSKQKSAICKENGIELMIEDGMHNARECAEAGIRVLLFDQPWNQGGLLPNMDRVRSWEEVLEKIAARN